MDRFQNIIDESIDELITKLVDKKLTTEEIAQNDDLTTMLAVNLEENNELIHVAGYGKVKLNDLKLRIKKMLVESFMSLKTGNYGELNHHFGTNGVGSSFITALYHHYNKE